MPYDRCHCDEPGIELRGCGHPFTQVCYCNDDGDGFTPATLWEPAIGVITDLGPLINQLNAEHIAACAAAPLPYRPLGSLLCRTCANELPDCTCFDGLDLTFSLLNVAGELAAGRRLRAVAAATQFPSYSSLHS
jgi:hypothetical protein